jgi:hypothetical protein
MAGKLQIAFAATIAILLLTIVAIALTIHTTLSKIRSDVEDIPPVSDIARQFSRERKLLSDNPSASVLFPPQIGAFKLQETVPLTLDTRKHLYGGATYKDFSGEAISLSVWQPTGWGFSMIWDPNFLTLSCGDLGGKVEAHRERDFPYRYGRCIGWGFSYHEFKWSNNGWVISASIGGASSIRPNIQKLVSFVNTYPH